MYFLENFHVNVYILFTWEHKLCFPHPSATVDDTKHITKVEQYELNEHKHQIKILCYFLSPRICHDESVWLNWVVKITSVPSSYSTIYTARYVEQQNQAPNSGDFQEKQKSWMSLHESCNCALIISLFLRKQRKS